MEKAFTIYLSFLVASSVLVGTHALMVLNSIN